ncbi:MAG TPA: acetamidase/formamidase family protein [Bryobacteraceae bacterium]|nr:acetamidase/formamidase family protein [Bryobacteraceae bacterium]
MPRRLYSAVLLFLFLSAAGARAETRRIAPDRYYDTFSAAHPPVARLRPGDTVVTKTLDSRGRDQSGQLIMDADNVLTGPFYIEGAEPGDTLVVTLDRVRLNRGWGWNGVRVSTDALAPETIEHLFPADCCDAWLQPKRHNALRWNLDLARGVVAPSRPLGGRAKLEFPARPALGCIGVAPSEAQAISSGSAGSFGGNIDFNGMGEGAIVYLPVFTPGALLFVGDGHAGHGDGELLGQGTETSMDVQFTVNLRKHHPIQWPRLENQESLVTFGLTPGAIERGFRDAISEMLRWLTSDYGLAPQEAHVLLGMAAELKVGSWFNTSVCQVPKKYVPRARQASGASGRK